MRTKILAGAFRSVWINPHELSGGYSKLQRRLRAGNDLSILIADEPTGNLTPLQLPAVPFQSLVEAKKSRWLRTTARWFTYRCLLRISDGNLQDETSPKAEAVVLITQ